MTIDELTGCVRDSLRINSLGARQMAARLQSRADGNSENLLIAALGDVPVFVFQEGSDDQVSTIYAEVAQITNGALARFDAGAAGRLADRLKAVAAFATGG
jgi:hypothetical protein